MKYALMSEVHANLPALEAVLADRDARREYGGVDAVYHIGDLLGYPPWPDEVVASIREREIPGVAGNYDSTAAADYKHCGCKAENEKAEELSHLSYEWTRENVLAGTKRFLGGCRSGWTSGPAAVTAPGRNSPSYMVRPR